MTSLNMLLTGLLLATVVVLSFGFGNSVYATSAPNLTFDNATYFFDHAFILNVTDTTQAGMNTPVIYVKVTSSAEPGHLYPLGLSDQSRGIYLSQPINFTTLYSSTNAMLKVSTSDQISAFYPNTSTSPSATSTVIASDVGTIPPPPNLNALISSDTQVLWGKVVYDCSRYGGDSDKDGICDAWEISAGQQANGLKIPYLAPIASGDVNGSYKLQCNPSASYDPYSTNYDPLGIHVCPGNDMPDVYIQVDWMKGHKPNISSISDVVQSFWHAPVKTCYPQGSNNCKTGIRLHVQLGNELPFHKDVITTTIPGGAGGTEFDGIKNVYFGTLEEKSVLDNLWLWQQNLTSKKQAFHYAMYIHSRAESPTSSGVSEQPGNDMAISLGRFTGAIGSYDQQEGTFMHELGHNLGLDHGGNVTDNCKPNYLSVMSYSRQFNESYPISRSLDYSPSTLPPITENSISESSGVGISNPPNLQTVYGVPTGQLFKTTWAGNSARQTLWLQFENNAQDSSGLNNLANVVNPTGVNPFTPNAKIGSAAFTSNGASYIAVSNSPSVDLKGAWTISAWVNFNVVNQQQAIVEKYDWTTTGGGYAVRLGSDGHVYVYVINGLSAQGLVSSAVLSANTWYHIVTTFDNNGHLNLYINGTLDSTNPSVTLNSMSSLTSLKVGARGNDAGAIINGAIDDLQIRNYAMSASDVRKLPESQAGMDANGNGIIDPGIISGPLAVNYLPAAGCDGSTVTPNILKGYDDWDNLMLNSKNFSSWSDGIKVVNYGAGASISISSSTQPIDSSAYPTIISPNFVTGTTSAYRNIHNPFSGMDNSTTESFNYEKGTSGPSHRPHNPNNMSQKNTIVFDYKPPGITTDPQKRDQLVNWLKTWGWKLNHNHNYTLPNEITMDQVRDIRSEKIQSINDHISILPIFVFSNASSDKIFLTQTLTQVDSYVKQDDLFDANYLLMNMSDEIKHRIIMPYPKEMVLSQINKTITGFTIASTTSSPLPKTITNTVSIGLDKNVYSWADRVYITVISPTDDWDPNLIDTIGNNINSTISISTDDHKLTNYKLVETGVDTGIFTGYVKLTGFNHDAFGNGHGIPPNITSGVGPTTGLLQANRTDHLTVMFKHGNQAAEKLVPIIWNVGQISWSKAVYSNSDTAVLQVIDPDLNIHPTVQDKFSILVNSTSDPIGIHVNMTETSEDSGVFQGIVHTSTGGSSGNQIHVANGDAIVSYYIDRTLPLPYQTSDILYKIAGAKIGGSAPSPQISATNMGIVDSFGNPVSTVYAKNPVQVTIDMTNGLDKDQPFAYLVQVQDSNGVTVSLSWITGTITAGQSLNPAQSWNPAAPGTYTVKTFLWQGIDTPNSLAPSQQMTVTVH